MLRETSHNLPRSPSPAQGLDIDVLWLLHKTACTTPKPIQRRSTHPNYGIRSSPPPPQFFHYRSAKKKREWKTSFIIGEGKIAREVDITVNKMGLTCEIHMLFIFSCLAGFFLSSHAREKNRPAEHSWARKATPFSKFQAHRKALACEYVDTEEWLVWRIGEKPATASASPQL
jgi:hypothetical protein